MHVRALVEEASVTFAGRSRRFRHHSQAQGLVLTDHVPIPVLSDHVRCFSVPDFDDDARISCTRLRRPAAVQAASTHGTPPPSGFSSAAFGTRATTFLCVKLVPLFITFRRLGILNNTASFVCIGTTDTLQDT